jgi:AcrR family transcriptional regulator
VRRSARERLPELVDAAMWVFTQQGYRGSQMADIARKMGVSEAALYRYVESKEGLFHLVIRQALLLEPLAQDALPLASPPLEVTFKELQARVADAHGTPCLEAALRRRRVEDPGAELEGIVRELFSLMTRTRRGMEMIERSARELPELARLAHVEMRRPLLEALTTYLTRRAQRGGLRRTPDSAATARLVLETVSWFARHRLSDPDGRAIDDDVAEETVVDMLVHALVPDSRSGEDTP